jgi:membrane protease YdiL (CAAX protease family)
VVVSLIIVGVETAGEIALGVSEDQSSVVVISLIPFICAGFMEELIFRGFAFYDKKGPKILWLSIIGASLLFALAHIQYYTEPVEGGAWWEKVLKIDPQSSWSLLILFVNSIWFYILRFAAINKHRSLIPCFAAHIGSNVGVFVVKLSQGHVTGWL